mgnify:CR=1 FL=1
MIDNSYYWVFVGLAVIWDLLASGAKSAFTHVRLPFLLNLRESDQVRVDRTIKLLEKQGLRTSLRLGLALAHMLLASAITLLLMRVFEVQQLWIIILALLISLLPISAMEFLVERAILDKPEKSAVGWTGIASLIDFFFTPYSRLMMALLGHHAEKLTLAVTDEALRDWVELEQPEGTLEKGEREMIYSIFRFGDTMAREIMVPRMDLLALDINTTISEARQEFIKAGHSRVPVYEDTIDNVIGLLYAKDLLSVVDGSDTIAMQRRLLRPAYFVPEAKKVDELLTEMQSRGIHMALVVDEYGGVAGVITLEDIVEEIVGEIRDEYDQAEELLYQQIGPDEFQFDGRTDLDDLNELLNTHLETEAADTLSGYIAAEIGRMPVSGDRVLADEWILTVEQVTGRRIRRVSARRLRPETSNEEKKDDPKR